MIFKKLSLLCIIAGIAFIVQAQSYVLQDTDLTVNEDGIITDCSYDFANKDITIPDIVNGITVTGIANVNVFGTAKIFCEKGITNVNLPSGIKTIGNYAFWVNDLTSVSLPDGLEQIGENAFSGNDFSFTEVDIPNTVTFIGKYAFTNNGIDSIILPTVPVAGFSGWVDNNGGEFAGGTKVKYTGDEYRAKIEYTLQDDDVEISADGLITSCSYNFAYTDIIIPDTLDGITVKGVENKSWNGVFDDKGITSLKLPNTMLHIGDNAFADNELETITIPGNVKYIGTKAFSSNNLDTVVLPNSVTYIGQQAFWSIDSIVLPTPTEPGFEHWIAGSGAIYQGGNKVKLGYEWFEAKIVYTLTSADVRIVNGVIDSCLYNFSSKYIQIPDSLDNKPITGIANGKEISFSNYYGVFSKKEIKEVKLNSLIDSIGNYAFYDNSLTSIIKLPNSVKYIGKDAFTLNSDFKGLILPSPVNGTLVCKNWIDNYNNNYAIGDTVRNFYGRFYSAQFTYPAGTSVISLSDTLTFNNVEVNTQQTKVLTISNIGNKAFTVSNIVLPQGFEADWTTGEILADTSQTVNITFLPVEEKTYSGIIKVISDATTGVDSVDVIGYTSPALVSVISLSDTLTFNNVEVNTQQTKVLTISNIGNKAFTVSNIVLPQGFEADWTTGEILADKSQTVNITFLPVEEKTYSGIIKVISDATTGVDSVAVIGYTSPELVSVISLSGTLTFNNVEVNTQQSKVLTISNIGNKAFTVSDIVLPQGFEADWTTGEILADTSQTVNITFLPVEEKTYSGVIEVISDAAKGAGTIEVSGAGTNDVSVFDNFATDNITVYPNPASTFIILPAKFNYANVEIFTVSGKLIEKQRIYNNKINIEHLENGMYIIKIKNNEFNITTNFIRK